MAERYYQTVISKPLIYDGLWTNTATTASNTVDKAIEDALHVLIGKYMKRLRVVFVSHTPLVLNNGEKDSVCLVVTILAEEVS